MVGRRDVYHVHAGVVQQVLDGCVGRLGAVALGKILAPLLISTVHGHQVRVLGLVDGRSHRVFGVIAGADNCPTNCHCESPKIFSMRLA